MQYPYSNDETMSGMFDSFEDEVRYRLSIIEQRLNSTCGMSEILQEIVRKELRQQWQTSVANNSGSFQNASGARTFEESVPKKLYFVVTTNHDENDVPLTFQVSGRTYDIRETLKTFGPAVFVKENKAWEFRYESETYTKIISYLTSLTNDVRTQTQRVHQTSADT